MTHRSSSRTWVQPLMPWLPTQRPRSPLRLPKPRRRKKQLKLELDVRGAETLAAQQRAATAVQGNTSTALPTNVAAAEVVKPSPAATARLEHAAARLAKLIERSGGPSIEAAGTVPTVQPLDTAAGTRQDGSSAFSSSSHDHGAALPEPVRVAGTSTPVFVIPQAAAAVTAGMSSLHAEAAAAPGARLHDADMLQQFVQTMRVQFRDGIGDAVLRLRPEHLGEVSIGIYCGQSHLLSKVASPSPEEILSHPFVCCASGEPFWPPEFR